MSVVVIGAGAAGVFAAISTGLKEAVIILEKTAVALAKVRISGGGRCNVTHSCFDPIQLITFYPRGGKELLGPFHRFQPRDTIKWFESHGVDLKTEPDGRIFPITNRSETIIQALLTELAALQIPILFQKRIDTITKESRQWIVTLKDGTVLNPQKIILATGSQTDGYLFAENLGHKIVPSVPSLFTFNVPTSPLNELSGVSIPQVQVSLSGTDYAQKGPLLITHFGFSGPAILKLSAWAARYLHEKNYKVSFHINWLPECSIEDIVSQLLKAKETAPKKNIFSLNLFPLPKNLWKKLVPYSDRLLVNLSKKDCYQLADKLHADCYQLDGKTTHKEEFVSCGGIDLTEVDFKTMESKICPGLYFAGEVLNIDGVTGGFNFQNAWTTGFIAGKACRESI